MKSFSGSFSCKGLPAKLINSLLPLPLPIIPGKWGGWLGWEIEPTHAMTDFWSHYLWQARVHSICNFHLHKSSSPFLQLRRRNQSCWFLGGAFHPPLPPVTVILVDDLDNVPSNKLQSCFLARNQIVFFWIIVKLCSHEHLKKKARGSAVAASGETPASAHMISSVRTEWITQRQEWRGSPGWCGSVAWAPAFEPKGCMFDSQSRHMPGLRARSPVGGVQEATTHWCFLSLSFSLPDPLSKINK